MSLLLLLAFLLHFYRLGSQSLWFDEILQLQLARTRVPVIWDNLQVHAQGPLYTYLLKMWIAVAGTSEFALRFLPASAGVLGIALFYRYLRIWLSTSAALIGCALLTLSPFYLYFSQEGRPYTLAVATTLAALLTFRQMLRGRNRWWVVLHALFLFISGGLHFTALAVVGGELLWVLAVWRKGRPPWKRILTSWVLASLPVLALVLHTYQALQTIYGSMGNAIDATSTIQTVAAGFGRYGWFPDYDASLIRQVAPLTLLSLAILAIPAAKSSRALWAVSLGIVGAQFGWTFVFLPLTGKLPNPSYNERHFLWSVPMVFAVVALGAQYGLRRRGWLLRLLAGVLVGVTVVLYIVGDVGYFTRYTKNAGRPAIDFVVDQAGEQDLILCNTRSAAATWTVYGDPRLRIWNNPKQTDDGWRFSPRMTMVIDGQPEWPHTWDQVLSYSRVWVFYLPRQGPPELMDSLRSAYPNEQAWTLGNIEVFLFTQ